MGRVEEFLDLYKQLEQLLESRYLNKKRRYSNIFIEFASNDPEGSRHREELNLCREVRNLLSHNARFEGEHAVEPSQSLVDFLRELIDRLNNPPTAKKIATPLDRILYATVKTPLLDILGKMQKMGYSHVPVLESGIIKGVLSAGTLLSFFYNHPDQHLGSESTIAELGDEIIIGRHTTESYDFTSPYATYEQLRGFFGEGGPKKKRLAAVFVTHNGHPNGKLLGVITPWDMLKVRQG